MDNKTMRFFHTSESGSLMILWYVLPPRTWSIVGDDEYVLRKHRDLRAFARQMDRMSFDKILEQCDAESVRIVINEDDLLAVVAVEPESRTFGAGMTLLDLEDAVAERREAKFLDSFEELRLAKLGFAPQADEAGMPCSFLEHLLVVVLAHDVAIVSLSVGIVDELFARRIKLGRASVATFVDDERAVAVFPRAFDKTWFICMFAFTFDVCYAISDLAVDFSKRSRAVSVEVGVGCRDKEVCLVDVVRLDLLVKPDEAL